MSDESIKEQTKKLDLIMNSINTSKQKHEDIEKMILELEWKEELLKNTINTLEWEKKATVLSLTSSRESNEAYYKQANYEKQKLDTIIQWIDINIEERNKEIYDLVIWYEKKSKELNNDYNDEISKLNLILDWVKKDIELSKDGCKMLEDKETDKKNSINELEWNITKHESVLSELSKGIENLESVKIWLVFRNSNLNNKNELLESKWCILENNIKGIEDNILSLKSKKQSIEKEVIGLVSEKDDYIKKKIALKDETDILAQKEIYLKNRYKESGIQR